MIEASRRRLLPRFHPALPRLGRRGLVALAVLIAILVGAFFWVRQSSLVAVRKVTVTGVAGPDAAEIRSELVQAGLGMSTLAPDEHRLHQIAAHYPVIHSLQVSTHFPHGLRIGVSEQIPVAVLQAGSRRITVSADGLLLAHPAPTAPLPTIALKGAPGGARVGGQTLNEVDLLAAAPYALLARVATAGSSSGGRGLTVTLRNGPAIYFGHGTRLAAKWRAAVTVLADPSSRGADYIDVTDPARPAAGTGSDLGRMATTPSSATTVTTTDPALDSASTSG